MGCRYDGLRARAANAVHGQRRDRDRQSGMDGGLACRVHLGAGLNDIAHDDRPDLLGIEAGACDGGLDGDGAEIGRRKLFQAPAKRPNRGSHRRDNNDRVLRHRSNSLSDSSDPYDELAEIAPVQHSNEGFGRVLQAIYDVFAIANAAVGNAGADFPQKTGVILRSKIVVDEPARGQARRHDLAHRRPEAVGSIITRRTIALGDQTAERYARIFIEQWQHRLPDRTADILEEDIDAVRTSRRQLAWKN